MLFWWGVGRGESAPMARVFHLFQLFFPPFPSLVKIPPTTRDKNQIKSREGWGAGVIQNRQVGWLVWNKIFPFFYIMMLRMKRIAAVASAFALSSSFCTAQQRSEFPFVETLTYNANNPSEDRFCYARLKSIPAFTASVFDGHGGDLTSEFASKHLNEFLDNRLKANLALGLTTDQLIERSLVEAYLDVERAFFEIFKKNLAEKVYRTVGSCALTAVVLRDSLHIANAGDCEGVLLSQKEAVMTNLRLNAGEKFEQERLFKLFPNEEDIVRCKSACYVKGRLQPTRSLGDFYLKYKEYNFTRIPVFTGPYIDPAPLVTHFPLTPAHKSLLLATDGLWDELDQRQVHGVFLKGGKDFGKDVFDEAMSIILKRNRLSSIHQLSKIPYRRDLHDDITLVHLRLDQLRSQL